MNRLAVLVVDDEPLARRRLLRHVRPLDWLGRVDEAATVGEAAEAIRNGQPDIVLLDIQMPDGTGFDLLRQLTEPVPTVVFVTAFNDQALQAFDARAVDYVTKPIVPARLREAMERARQAATSRLTQDRISELEETVAALRRQPPPRPAHSSELWVKHKADYIRLDIATITHVQAERDYVRIHVPGREFLHHESLTTMARLLPADAFLRIHRSTLVRLDAVERVKAVRFSSLVAVLTDGSELRIGRTYTASVRAKLATSLLDG